MSQSSEVSKKASHWPFLPQKPSAGWLAPWFGTTKKSGENVSGVKHPSEMRSNAASIAGPWSMALNWSAVGTCDAGRS